MYLNFSIQAPGFGRILSIPGKIIEKRKGLESPIAIKLKMRIISKLDDVRAKVRAVPKKGALQGVERIVARTPEKKSLR